MSDEAPKVFKANPKLMAQRLRGFNAGKASMMEQLRGELGPLGLREDETIVEFVKRLTPPKSSKGGRARRAADRPPDAAPMT